MFLFLGQPDGLKCCRTLTICMVDLFSDSLCHSVFFIPAFLTVFFPPSCGEHVVFYFAGRLFCQLFFPPMAKKVCFLHGSQLVAPFHIYRSSTKTLKLKECWFNAKKKTVCISR